MPNDEEALKPIREALEQVHDPRRPALPEVQKRQLSGDAATRASAFWPRALPARSLLFESGTETG